METHLFNQLFKRLFSNNSESTSINLSHIYSIFSLFRYGSGKMQPENRGCFYKRFDVICLLKLFLI